MISHMVCNENAHIPYMLSNLRVRNELIIRLMLAMALVLDKDRISIILMNSRKYSLSYE